MAPLDRKNHFCVISGPFEILSPHEPISTYKSSFLSAKVILETSGVAENELLSHEMIAIGYGENVQALKPGNLYAFRGRLVAPYPSTQPPWLFHDVRRPLLIADADEFPESIHDKVSVTALGVVVECYSLFEESVQPTNPKERVPDNKNSTVVIMKHSDFHAVTKVQHSFEVEYRCRPRLHLVGVHQQLKAGRETVINGYLIGYDTIKHRFIVDINYAVGTTGHEKAIPSDAKVTPGGRIKASRSVSNCTVSESTLSQSNSSSPLKGPTDLVGASASMKFPPSDFNTSSFCTKKTDSPPPKKKRAGAAATLGTSNESPPMTAPVRRPRARRAKRVLAEDNDEDITFA